jgi:hypothetical protein
MSYGMSDYAEANKLELGVLFMMIRDGMIDD